MSSNSELLAGRNQTFAEQAGITLVDKPSPLFRLLVLTALLSANIDHRLGIRAARALGRAKLTTARRMSDAGQDTRWQVLSDSKYLRKVQTARQLGRLADEVLDRYAGDLRRLHTADAEEVGAAIGQFTGIGPLGADIFCREVQTIWRDLQPFADPRMRELARKHGLPGDAAKLAGKAGTDDLSRLGAALVDAD